MDTPLLATKLFIPPVPHKMIPRLNAVNRLDEGLRQGRRLTLITAPPGYGKTSLIASWVSSQYLQAGLKFCWLALDESDNDPAQFWTYLLASLQTCQANLGASLAQSIWPQPNPAIVKKFLIGLVNEVASLEERLVFVLDDFHLIQNETILNGLTFLIEHLPTQLHPVFLSRSVPPLPLSRWRSRNQITELGQGDLHFTQAETQAFLEGQIGGISSAEAQIIHTYLEGWPAGLQLTVFAMRSQPLYDDTIPVDPLILQLSRSPARTRERVLEQLPRAHSFLVDYLTDEVLNHLPEPVQAFLLRTSILEWLCPALCAVMMGGTPYPKQDLQALLAQLEKQNLFLIPLDPERKWFRYQRLFAEILQAHLAVQVPTHEIQDLHRRAAAWYQEQGFGAEGIRHALKGNQIEIALNWAESLAPDYLQNGRIHAYLSLLDDFPAGSFNLRPNLALYHTQALIYNGQYASAWEHIRSFEAQNRFEADSGGRHELASLKALLATFTRSPDEAIGFARQALSVFPAEDLISQARMHLILGAMHRLEARLPEAADEILEAQRLAKHAGQPHLENTALENLAALRIQAGDYLGAEKILSKTASSRLGIGFGQILLAAIELEWDHLAAAEAHLSEGLRLGEKSGVIDVLVNGYVCLSQLRWAQEDRKGSVEAIKLASELSQASPGSLWGPLVAMEWRWLGFKLKEAPDLAILIDQPENDVDPEQPQPNYVRLIDGLITVRSYLAGGNRQPALALVQAIQTECERAGLIRLLVEALLLKAILYQAAGDRSQALSELGQALRTAAPDRFVRVFVDEGEPVQLLLEIRSAIAAPEEADRIRQLLSHFPPVAAISNGLMSEESHAKKLPPVADLVEPLTAREGEVLQLLAEGCTNREIADRLVMTENTVKKHTSHIFGKMMVSNRTQALVKGRELGLIR